jgi:nicotinamide riboside kinase
VRGVGFSPPRNWFQSTVANTPNASSRAFDPDASVFDIRWEAEDFAVVADRQNADEDAAAGRDGPLLFCDPDSFATRVWEERYVGVTSEAVIAESDRHPGVIPAHRPRRASG